MFPWSPEFKWDAYHVAFFGALYSVIATVAATLAVAAWRAWRDARDGRVAAVAWHADFEELPASSRACRHQLTGEAPGRVCENAFECRCCAAHPRLEALREAQAEAGPSAEDAPAVGYDMPLDRFYHRGHTWARLEVDGTVTVGLDGVARRLVGEPEAVELPSPGTKLVVNGPAVRVRSRGSDVRVLSPVDGTVLAASGTGAGFTLRVVPVTPLDARHLLWGREARLWAVRELERLQRAAGVLGDAPALADGGELVADLGAALPPDRYDAVLGEMMLDS